MPRSTGRRSTPARRDRKSTRLNSSHTVIYTLSLHDALPILTPSQRDTLHTTVTLNSVNTVDNAEIYRAPFDPGTTRSEEHTSELQSHSDLHSFPTRRSSDLDPEPARHAAHHRDPELGQYGGQCRDLQGAVRPRHD